MLNGETVVYYFEIQMSNNSQQRQNDCSCSHVLGLPHLYHPIYDGIVMGLIKYVHYCSSSFILFVVIRMVTWFLVFMV